MGKRIVRLTKIKEGTTKNHLCFEGVVPYLDINKKWQFDFIGVDITSTASLTESAKEDLCNQLCRDFGYAPYNLAKVKEKFGYGRDYEVKVW